jgi:hypothetical protein
MPERFARLELKYRNKTHTLKTPQPTLNLPYELKKPRDLGQMACGAKGVLCGRRKTPVS